MRSIHWVAAALFMIGCGLPEPQSLDAPQLVAVTAQDKRSCGLDRDGMVFCWGAEDSLTPVLTPHPLGLPIKFRALADQGTCGFPEAGDPICWTGVSGTSLVVLRGAPPLVSLHLGAFPCGAAGDGAIWCWAPIATGPGAAIERVGPGVLTGLGVGDFACGLTATGHARCFGGILPDTLTPVEDSVTWKSLVPMHGWACGIRTTDSLACFTFSPVPTYGPVTKIPTTPITDGTKFVAIRGMQNRATFQSDGGGLYFKNSAGTLATAEGSGASWLGFTAGQFHTCGELASGRFACFGLNDFGQIGDGTTTTRTSGVLVGGGAP